MHRITVLSLILLTGAMLGTPTLAAPLELSQRPARLSREPAPNVIVSVGNASSLGDADLQVLKNALRTAFSGQRLDDGRIRLAWQAMHGCRGLPGNAAACQGHNAMRRLEGEHRQRFLAWVDGLDLGRGSPSHGLMDAAGQYLSATHLGIDSPWNADPGRQAEPVLACRPSHQLLLSDGVWSNASTKGVDTAGPDHVRVVRGDNPDNSPIRLPDGTDYTASNEQTRLYRDPWGSSTVSTLADLAFHYWSTDLQPGVANQLLPRWQMPRASENFGTSAAPRCWNRTGIRATTRRPGNTWSRTPSACATPPTGPCHLSGRASISPASAP